jgi:hypothetical protein
MLAPISILMPAAIEKNAVAEEMSRMRGRGLGAHYSISRTSQGERNSPLQGWPDLATHVAFSNQSSIYDHSKNSCLNLF